MSDEQLLTQAVEALARPGEISPELIGALSHLLQTDVASVSAAWGALPVERRLEILTQLGRSERANARQDFNAIYGLALHDAEPRVRRLAIDSFVTENGPVHLERLTDLAANDPDPYVREAAVIRLGPFALMAELGELPEPWPDRLRTLRKQSEKLCTRGLDSGLWVVWYNVYEIRMWLFRRGGRLVAVSGTG